MYILHFTVRGGSMVELGLSISLLLAVSSAMSVNLSFLSSKAISHVESHGAIIGEPKAY